MVLQRSLSGNRGGGASDFGTHTDNGLCARSLRSSPRQGAVDLDFLLHQAGQLGVIAAALGFLADVQASQAGAEILRKGGSAVDAAIAANAVLGVTEPMMNGMGGDLFAIYWEAKTGKLYGLNSSGWAPQALTIEHLRARDVTSMPQSGIDSVTVPGAVAGWGALHGRFGRLPWKDIFQSAIFYAREGYPVPELIHGFWEDAPEMFAKDPEGQKVYLRNGKPPGIGEIFRNPDLAKALALVDCGCARRYVG